MYIALEGIDTCGKSTQIHHLQKSFPDALFTKEPGGSSLGTILRPLLLGGTIASKEAELFLFLADRAEHIEEVIKPNYNEKLIISDRSFISGFAYAPFDDISFLLKMNYLAIGKYLPHKVIFLELTENELKHRLSSKNNDSIESRGIDYLVSIQTKMKNFINSLPILSLTLDASLPPLTLHHHIKDFIHD